VFSTSHTDERADLSFIAEFASDLSEPVDQDGREHIDYVPTQIVTEYFRRLFPSKVDGILYASCQNDGGRSCVLFVDNDGCREAALGWEMERDAALGLVAGCLRTYGPPGALLRCASVRRARARHRAIATKRSRRNL
jgi:hypothetical protein